MTLQIGDLNPGFLSIILAQNLNFEGDGIKSRRVIQNPLTLQAAIKILFLLHGYSVCQINSKNVYNTHFATFRNVVQELVFSKESHWLLT